MRTVTYTDSDGFSWRVELPDGAEDSDASRGVPIGPPDVRVLEIPEALAKRLHAALAARGLFTYNDVLKAGGMRAILSAWQQALQVDASQVMQLYTQEIVGNGHRTK